MPQVEPGFWGNLNPQVLKALFGESIDLEPPLRVRFDGPEIVCPRAEPGRAQYAHLEERKWISVLLEKTCGNEDGRLSEKDLPEVCGFPESPAWESVDCIETGVWRKEFQPELVRFFIGHGEMKGELSIFPR